MDRTCDTLPSSVSPSRDLAAGRPVAQEASIAAVVSREIVRAYAHLHGRGPTRAKTVLSGGLVVCVLEDTFTKAESLLVDRGRFDQVRRRRRAFEEEAASALRGAVEAATGRAVRGFVGEVDDRGTASQIFFLDGSVVPVPGASVDLPDDTSVGLEPDRSELREVRELLVRRWAELYGHRPGSARIDLDVRRQTLRFSFVGGLSPCDRLLIGRGRGAVVRDFLQAFVDAVSEEISSIVSDGTGVPVTPVGGTFLPELRQTDIYLVLAPTPLDDNDDVGALSAWRAQAVRRSRDLAVASDRLGARSEALVKELDRIRKGRRDPVGSAPDPDGDHPRD